MEIKKIQAAIGTWVFSLEGDKKYCRNYKRQVMEYSEEEIIEMIRNNYLSNFELMNNESLDDITIESVEIY